LRRVEDRVQYNARPEIASTRADEGQDETQKEKKRDRRIARIILRDVNESEEKRNGRDREGDSNCSLKGRVEYSAIDHFFDDRGGERRQERNKEHRQAGAL